MRALCRAWLGALCFLLLSCGAAIAAPPQPLVPDEAAILQTMRRAADWQLKRLDRHSFLHQRTAADDPRDWQQAVFWLGLTALADAGGDPRYREAILALGGKQGWRPGDRLRHADDHLIGQTWLWAARHGAGDAAIAPLRAQMDRLLANRSFVSLDYYESGFDLPGCMERWCWSDALFMAPATLFGLSALTGDQRYAGFADREYHDTIAALYDHEESLFYRDSRFIGRRDRQGHKLFWSRGNGWALAGLANSLAAMPPGSARARFYAGLFRDMAGHIAGLQGPDGYWSASLLSPDHRPETSGTALFVYALAWGVNEGLLDHDRYTPVILRGWDALARAIRPDGRLGYVQPVGDRPAHAGRRSTAPYGVGALLLAGSAVLRLSRDGKPGQPMSLTAPVACRERCG